MAWAYRASSYADDGGGFAGVGTGDTQTVTLGAAASSGDLLLLCVCALDNGATGSGAADVPTFAVSDSVNGSTGWVEATTQTTTMLGGWGTRQSVWVRPNSASGTPVITVTFTVTGNSGGIGNKLLGGLMCAAFSGLATSSVLDTSAAANASAGASSSPNSGSASPATGAANELVVGYYHDPGEGCTLAAGNIGGSAATLAGRHQSDANFWQGLLEYRDSGSSGATPSATVTPSAATNWLMIEAALNVTGGGSVTGTVAMTLRGLTAAASGWTTVSGTAALALQRPSLVVTGTASTVVSGTAAFTLAPLSVAAIAYTDISSSIALVLQRPAVSASGIASGTLPHDSYSTAFPLTENPMSEGSVWVQGLADGLDWTNIRTTSGKSFGTENPAAPHLFDDSLAVLRGVFTSDQIATATVFDTLAGGDYSQEVEILLRFNITAHIATGYEINWSANPSNAYCTIVRWDGAVGSFTTLNTTFPGAVTAGDVIIGRIVGSTITGFKNGVQVITATDATITSGNPGLGAYADNGASGVADATLSGLTRYLATSMPVGTASLVLNPISVAASGVTTAPNTGTVAVTLQRIGVVATGSSILSVNGTVALLLQPVALVATGISSASTTGTAALVLKRFVVLATGWTTIAGTAVVTLQRLTVVAAGTGTVLPPPPVPVPVPTPEPGSGTATSNYLDFPIISVTSTPPLAGFARRGP